MNDELKKQIAEIELEAKKRIEDICKKAMEENKKQGKAWTPKVGETVWFWSCCGAEHLRNYIYDIDEDYLNSLYDMGELFPTKEACEEAHNAKILRTKWKRLAAESGEEDNPWDSYCEHWWVCYDLDENKIDYYINDRIVTESVYFTSMEAIVAAVAEIGEDNVKKYILGIKE